MLLLMFGTVEIRCGRYPSSLESGRVLATTGFQADLHIQPRPANEEHLIPDSCANLAPAQLKRKFQAGITRE